MATLKENQIDSFFEGTSSKIDQILSQLNVLDSYHVIINTNLNSSSKFRISTCDSDLNYFKNNTDSNNIHRYQITTLKFKDQSNHFKLKISLKNNWISILFQNDLIDLNRIKSLLFDLEQLDLFELAYLLTMKKKPAVD